MNTNDHPNHPHNAIFRILASNAYKAVKAVYRPMSKVNKTFPVLAHVLIRFHAGAVAFTTHDLDKPLTETSPALWKGEPFETCVPMRALKDFLGVMKQNKDEVLTFMFDSHSVRLIVTTDPHDGMKSRTEFLCLDANEFPHVALPS